MEEELELGAEFVDPIPDDDDKSRDPDPGILERFDAHVNKLVGPLNVIIDEIKSIAEVLRPMMPYDLLGEISNKHEIIALGRALDTCIKDFKKAREPIVKEYNTIVDINLALASRTFCRDLHHIYFTIGKFNEHVEVLNSVERIYIMYKCIVGGIKYHPTSPGREYYFIDSLGQPWLLWNADAKYGGLQCMKNGLWKSYADTSTWNNHSRQHMNIIITLM